MTQIVEVPNPQWQALSDKQKDFSKRIRQTLSRMTAHTNSKMFEYGYIPAVPLNEKDYWEEILPTLRETFV